MLQYCLLSIGKRRTMERERRSHRPLVGRATTGGEPVRDDLGDGRARKFLLLLVAVAVGKAAVDGWA